MSKEESVALQEMNKVLSQIDGAETLIKHNSRFIFRLYVTQSMEETPIEGLDLTVRAYNSLRRAGFDTVGDLLNALESGFELKSIKNCGVQSVRDIKIRLFLLQYNSLPAHKRNDYLAETIAMNQPKVA